MRPNQNKNRQRGRNGGRKHVNPLSRNYESNGPDVKVRGNASHIAEKYLQLARDAQSSGDSVMAENYLQHAEHYFRIVSSAQQAMNGPREGQSQDENEFEDDGNDVNSRFSSPQPPQPVQQNNDSESEQAPAAAEAGDKSGEDAAAASVEGEGEQPARKPRERRPRRRRNTGGEAGAAPADANAPEPEPAPELPAFLTGNAAE